jgi:glucose/arabinose dehydrogenase
MHRLSSSANAQIDGTGLPNRAYTGYIFHDEGIRLMIVRLILTAAFVTGLTAPATAADKIFPTERGRISVATVTDGLSQPWGIDFLPDGRMIVTEKPGRLRIVTPGAKISKPITGLPRVDDNGQGGLLVDRFRQMEPLMRPLAPGNAPFWPDSSV